MEGTCASLSCAARSGSVSEIATHQYVRQPRLAACRLWDRPLQPAGSRSPVSARSGAQNATPIPPPHAHSSSAPLAACSCHAASAYGRYIGNSHSHRQGREREAGSTLVGLGGGGSPIERSWLEWSQSLCSAASREKGCCQICRAPQSAAGTSDFTLLHVWADGVLCLNMLLKNTSLPAEKLHIREKGSV